MIERIYKQVQLGSWILVAVLALSGLWLVQSIDQLRRSGNVSDTITVSGTGKVTAKPDVAVADLAISVEAPTAAGAQNDASRRSDAVVAYLEKSGIDEKDVRTSNYSIYPQYDYIEGRTRIRGYQVTQTLEVKMRDLDKANQILDGVVDAGVNQVNNFRFTIDDPEALQNEAREKAIADANEKANDLEDQLDVRLGRIVSFSENSGGFPSPLYMREASMDIGGAGNVVKAESAPQLPQGENEVTVQVTVTYQLK
jgi:uncharacterized protein